MFDYTRQRAKFNKKTRAPSPCPMTVDRWHQEKGARAHSDIWNSWDSPQRFASRCKSPLLTSVSSHNLWMFISAKLTTWPRTPISPFRKKKIEAYLSFSFLRTSWLHGFASRNYRIAERICLVLLRLFTGKPIILFFPLQKEDKRGSFNLSSVAGLLLSGIILLGFLYPSRCTQLTRLVYSCHTTHSKSCALIG